MNARENLFDFSILLVYVHCCSYQFNFNSNLNTLIIGIERSRRNLVYIQLPSLRTEIMLSVITVGISPSLNSRTLIRWWWFFNSIKIIFSLCISSRALTTCRVIKLLFYVSTSVLFVAFIRLNKNKFLRLSSFIEWKI